MKFLLFSINLVVHYGVHGELNLNLMVKKRESARVRATHSPRTAIKPYFIFNVKSARLGKKVRQIFLIKLNFVAFALFHLDCNR